MYTRLLSLLSRRLFITTLLVGVSFAGISLVLFQHGLSVDAASSSSHPYYVVKIGGQKYIAQYEGGAYNSDVTSHSIYMHFGHWNEYTVDSHGTWHWFGQFSGNENTYVNGHGQVQTGVNAVVPGIGHIDTYGHEDVINPHLSPPPAGFKPVVAEHYAGMRLFGTKNTNPIKIDCEVYASNVANGRYGSGTHQLKFNSGQHVDAQDQACFNADDFLDQGDAGISRLFHSLALSSRVNNSAFASLLRPQILPVPVIMGIASGVFFIGASVTGSICAFATCSNTTKKVLAAVTLGMGIISGVLGLGGQFLTAMKAYAQSGAVTLAAIGAEASGELEMFASLRPALAPRANSEASLLSSISRSGSITALP